MTKEETNTIDITTFDNQMVEIPSGKIELRDDTTKERWTVDVKPILIAKFPVTQELYFAITNEDPSTIKGNRHPVEKARTANRFGKSGGSVLGRHICG